LRRVVGIQSWRRSKMQPAVGVPKFMFSLAHTAASTSPPLSSCVATRTSVSIHTHSFSQSHVSMLSAPASSNIFTTAVSPFAAAKNSGLDAEHLVTVIRVEFESKLWGHFLTWKFQWLKPGAFKLRVNYWFQLVQPHLVAREGRRVAVEEVKVDAREADQPREVLSAELRRVSHVPAL
jgi:hypothetical protein